MMTEFLSVFEKSKEAFQPVDPMLFVLALVASLIASFVAGGLYQYFYESRATGSQVYRSFPLLGISITTLFMAIQLSLPLSLGLLGALSIIRFRTPIKEPEEVGFIMLVIAASVSCSTLNFHFLLMLYVAAVAALLFQRHKVIQQRQDDGLLIIHLPGELVTETFKNISEYLKQNSRRIRLESTSNRDNGTSLQFAFSGLAPEAPELIQFVKEHHPSAEVNLHFNRPGGLR